MKAKIVLFLLLCSVAMLPEYKLSAQLGNCTNYGCVPLAYMSQILNLGNGWQPGCLGFDPQAQVLTGRKVRHTDPQRQGKNPIRVAGRQVILWGTEPCPVCAPPIPQNQNVIAIAGTGQAFMQFQGTFGKYKCPPLANILNP